MRRQPTAACAVAALAACSGPPAETPSPAVRLVSDSAVVAEREHVSEAGTRRYRLHVPATTPAGAPLVVWLHGCTQDAAGFAAASRMDALAEAGKVIVVYPEQPASANPVKCWNWFAPEHQARGAGEPAMIAAITRDVAREFGADTNRIHIGGLSAGGAMAVVSAIAYPDLFASVASHAGIGWRMASDVASGLAVMKTGGSAPDSLGAAAHAAMGRHARVIPLFAFHGMQDVVAAPAASQNLAAQFAAIARAAGATLRMDSMAGTAGEYSYRMLRFRDGHERTIIEAWFVDSLGHALSGGASGARWVDARGPDATREMLRFFLEHPRQRQ